MPAVKGVAHWTDNATTAHAQAQKGLGVVDSLLSWIKSGSGAPNADERNLFMAAVAFAYGVWENYVEQLAIEVAAHLSEKMDPSRVPEEVHQEFTKNHSTWEIAVTPGWRALWMTRVSTAAVGDASSFGLNTASRNNVERLFK